MTGFLYSTSLLQRGWVASVTDQGGQLAEVVVDGADTSSGPSHRSFQAVSFRLGLVRLVLSTAGRVGRVLGLPLDSAQHYLQVGRRERTDLININSSCHYPVKLLFLMVVKLADYDRANAAE